MKKIVFVTVGSTKFDELIQAIDDLQVADAFISKGYVELIIQRGRGDYQMKNLLAADEEEKVLKNGLTVRCFDYAPTIAKYIEEASLIICHAGAGSLFEGLQANKMLLVVPNPRLMDNHQVELASRLEQDHYLFSSSPESLLQKIKALDESTLVPYKADSPAQIVARIDQLFPRRR